MVHYGEVKDTEAIDKLVNIIGQLECCLTVATDGDCTL